AEVINGKELAKELREEMKNDVFQLKDAGIVPHLTVILIGNNPASASYVRGKEKASSEVGLSSEVIKMDADTTESALLQKIKELNNEQKVHGILVQLPLPDHIDE